MNESMDRGQRRLPGGLVAVGIARHWVSSHCASTLSEGKRQVLELLTSEVVANAVLHGGEPVTVEVGCAPGEVTVTVSDSSLRPPQVKSFDLEATGGRGVALVDVLSDEWGWDLRPPGKRIWFRVTDDC